MSNKGIRSRNRQGLDKVLDGHRAFINFNAQMLMSDLVDILPADKVILEILENIANQDIIERLFELKTRGFKLALDDVVSGGAELEPLAWPPSSKPDQDWLDRVFAEHNHPER
jgi:c-di-GMP-related signal transduction protein